MRKTRFQNWACIFYFLVGMASFQNCSGSEGVTEDKYNDVSETVTFCETLVGLCRDYRRLFMKSVKMSYFAKYWPGDEL